MIKSELSILDTMECNNSKYRMNIGYLSDASVLHPFCRDLKVKKWEGAQKRK